MNYHDGRSFCVAVVSAVQMTSLTMVRRLLGFKYWYLSTLLKIAACKRIGVFGGKTKPNSQCLQKKRMNKKKRVSSGTAFCPRDSVSIVRYKFTYFVALGYFNDM